MSKRFKQLFFLLVFLANLFFIQKTEPNDIPSIQERALSIFLFQFDYFLLFIYLLISYNRNPDRIILFLMISYGILFSIGMTSLIIVDEKEFDIFYSIIQPIIRTVFIIIFIKIQPKNQKKQPYSVILYLMVTVFAGFILYQLNYYPRVSMFTFNIYWIVIYLFLIAGIYLHADKKVFITGIIFTGIADLYYILPPEARLFELTFMLVRTINTIGEFLIVDYILKNRKALI
jgi:hypothetical protein